MTLVELYNTLAGTGLPVAYEAFPEGQELPCITYNFSYSSNFSADSKVYKKLDNIDIFLFTATKDTVREKLVEDALDNAYLFWNKQETFLEDEKAFRIVYEVEIDG